MFYKNKIKEKKTKNDELLYDLLANNQKIGKDDSVLDYSIPTLAYNFTTQDESLRAGYGFENLKMPLSLQDIENESLFVIRGNEVKGLWNIKWFDNVQTFTDKYFLYYFNDENNVCYNNILGQRYTVNIIPTDFTQTPVSTYYRQNGFDSLLLSGPGEGVMVINSNGVQRNQNAPKILSCCVHYGKLFAITEGDRGKLVYADETDILQWTSQGLENIDFGDGRGNVNKIISFDDYLYLFRDFGITQLSIYGKDENFSVSHMYFSDSYIYPNSISQSGDKIYFLTKSGLKVFNGTKVKDIEIDAIKLVNRCDNDKCSAVCFEGKYYLACKGDFGDNKSIGCESYTNGYINNMLLVYDLLSEKVEVVRGVDIHQVLALNNPYRPKLIACFNKEHIGKIGQLSFDGKIFGSSLPSYISFAKSDFGKANVKKRIKSFLICSQGDCQVKISNEKKTYAFSVSGKSEVQKIRTNIIGKTFSVKIECGGSETKVNKFVLTIGQEK